MTEDLLRDALRERADRTAYEPTPLTQVATAARVIRRRRRTTGVLVAAAAIVVVTVPIAVVTSRSDTDSAPVGPGPTEPALTPDASAPPPEVGVQAAPPRIAYAVDGQIVNPDGTRVDLPDEFGLGGQFTPYQGGFLLAATYEGYVLFRVDSEGGTEPGGCSGGLAITPDGETTAWSTTPCLHSSEGRNMIHAGPTNGTRGDESSQEVSQWQPQIAGFLGDQVVFSERAGAAWITDLIRAPRRIAGMGSVSGVDSANGWVAGQLENEPDQSAVIDIDTGTYLWQAPDLTLGRFSPDGRHIVGYGPKGSMILQAGTGTKVGDIGTVSGFAVEDLTWEDQTHLLGTAMLNSARVVVRVGLDGSVDQHPVIRVGSFGQVAFALRP